MAACVFPIVSNTRNTCCHTLDRSRGHTPRSFIYPFCTLLMNHNCSIHATCTFLNNEDNTLIRASIFGWDCRDLNTDAQTAESIMYSKPLLNHTAQPQTTRCTSRAMFETWGTLSALTLDPTSLQYQIPSVPSEIECIPLSICNTLLWQHITSWVHVKCTLTQIIPLLHSFWIVLLQAENETAFPAPSVFNVLL